MEIREKISFLLKKNNVSQRQLAESQGMSAGNLSQILAGKQNMSLDFILNLKKEFPTLDFNQLLDDGADISTVTSVSEEKTAYADKQITPIRALQEIKKILEKAQI